MRGAAQGQVDEIAEGELGATYVQVPAQELATDH